MHKLWNVDFQKKNLQYSIPNAITSTTPMRLSTIPNANIWRIEIPPLLNTIALGGVLIGNINAKPALMVTMSIVRLCVGASRKLCVAANTTGKKIAISAVELINIVAKSVKSAANSKNSTKGKSAKYTKICWNASPSWIFEIAIAIQKPAPNKKIISYGMSLESSHSKNPILGAKHEQSKAKQDDIFIKTQAIIIGLNW